MNWEEAMPNTYRMAKESFMRECEKDPKFREEMVKKGVLVLLDETGGRK